MVVSLWCKNKHYLLKNMQKQHFVTMSVDCDLSESVCVRIIDDMIGKPPCVIYHLRGPLLYAGFSVEVVNAQFSRIVVSFSKRI